MDQTERPPLSRLYAISELRDNGHEIVIAANPEERAGLAKLNGLPGIARLDAGFRITRRGRHGLSVKGQVRAQVTQTCVVSLEPFDIEIDEAFDVRFEPQSRKPKVPAADEADFASLPEDDPPDPIVDGRIDLGALAGEYLALGLDPYPRKPGAVFAAEAAGAAAEKQSPFASLKQKLDMKGNKN